MLTLKSLQRIYEVPYSPTLTPHDLLDICHISSPRAIVYHSHTLPSNHTLHQSGVTNDAVLLIVSLPKSINGIPVTITRGGRTFTMICNSETTIRDVKIEQSQKLGLRLETLIATQQDTEVTDEICVNTILPGESLRLDLRIRLKPRSDDTFTVTVKTLTGRSYPIDIDPRMTVADLKEIIAEKEGLSFDTVRLICAGHGLCDDETVGQLRMTESSVVHLVLRLR